MTRPAATNRDYQRRGKVAKRLLRDLAHGRRYESVGTGGYLFQDARSVGVMASSSGTTGYTGGWCVYLSRPGVRHHLHFEETTDFATADVARIAGSWLTGRIS